MQCRISKAARMGVERIALLVTVLAVAAMAASGAPFEEEGPGSGEREGRGSIGIGPTGLGPKMHIF